MTFVWPADKSWQVSIGFSLWFGRDLAVNFFHFRQDLFRRDHRLDLRIFLEIRGGKPLTDAVVNRLESLGLSRLGWFRFLVQALRNDFALFWRLGRGRRLALAFLLPV